MARSGLMTAAPAAADAFPSLCPSFGRSGRDREECDVLHQLLHRPQQQPAASKKRRKATASKNKFLQNASASAADSSQDAASQGDASAAATSKASRLSDSMINPTAMRRMAHQGRRTSNGDQEPAAAKSVMEAQVRGEELQVVDDATYALDGLSGTTKESVRRENAAVLASICASRRGLGALATEGMMPELLGALEASLASSNDKGGHDGAPQGPRLRRQAPAARGRQEPLIGRAQEG